jgi:hypothetical protein
MEVEGDVKIDEVIKLFSQWVKSRDGQKEVDALANQLVESNQELGEAAQAATIPSQT